MKLIDKAVLAKAAKDKQEYQRGSELADAWLLNTNSPAPAKRLRDWSGSSPKDIEELCDIAVGYHDASSALSFLTESLGPRPATCRRCCIAGFFNHINSTKF